MTNAKNGDLPNPHYAQEDWDEVSDNPELTPEDFAQARPAAEVLGPAFMVSIEKRRRGRPPVANPKEPVKVRLRADVLARWKASGPGWQTRMSEVLEREAPGA